MLIQHADKVLPAVLDSNHVDLRILGHEILVMQHILNDEFDVLRRIVVARNLIVNRDLNRFMAGGLNGHVIPAPNSLRLAKLVGIEKLPAIHDNETRSLLARIGHPSAIFEQVCRLLRLGGAPNDLLDETDDGSIVHTGFTLESSICKNAQILQRIIHNDNDPFPRPQYLGRRSQNRDSRNGRRFGVCELRKIEVLYLKSGQSLCDFTTLAFCITDVSTRFTRLGI